MSEKAKSCNVKENVKKYSWIQLKISWILHPSTMYAGMCLKRNSQTNCQNLFGDYTKNHCMQEFVFDRSHCLELT